MTGCRNFVCYYPPPSSHSGRPAAVAACYIDNNKSRVLALFEERPRGAFPGDIEGLYLGELDKWPQELAALAKKGSDNVQNPKL